MISGIKTSAYAPIVQQNSAQQTNAVRSEKSNEASSLSPKAAEIAKRLEAGEYKLDMNATAAAMLNELRC